MTKEELNEELKSEREDLIEDISDWCDEIKDTIEGYGEEDINDVFLRKRTTLDWLMNSYDGYLTKRINEFNNNVEELIEAYEQQEEE